MRTGVYFAGEKPCVAAVATAISGVAQQATTPLPPPYMPEKLPVLFLGTCSVGSKPHKEAITFAELLTSQRTKNVALFCTNPKCSDEPLKPLKSILEAKGINVIDTFVCHGKGGLFSKEPSEEELQKACVFAEKVLAASETNA